MEFKIGQTVRLKSGGPLMTITDFIDDEIECIWFDKGKKMKDKFHVDTLDIDDRSSGISFGVI